MSEYDLDGAPPPDQLEELLPSRTTEQIMDSMVAANPGKHGLTLAQRIAQMTALLKRDNEPDDYQRVYELRVEQIGGDPDEMMSGNRPRYTMGDDLEIKDHETGQVHYVDAQAVQGTEVVEEGTVGAPQGTVPDTGAEHDRLAAGDQPSRIATPGDVLVAASTGAADSGEPGDVQGESVSDAPKPAREGVDQSTVQGRRDHDQLACDHSFPDPVEAETPCALCGVKFSDWADS